jgi:hypothetical protein
MTSFGGGTNPSQLSTNTTTHRALSKDGKGEEERADNHQLETIDYAA